MFLLQFAGNYKSSEIGCTETAGVGMTFREIGHVMGTGYTPREASKHARTSHTPSARWLRQAPALRQPPVTSTRNLRVCTFPRAY